MDDIGDTIGAASTFSASKIGDPKNVVRKTSSGDARRNINAADTVRSWLIPNDIENVPPTIKFVDAILGFCFHLYRIQRLSFEN